MEKEKEMEQIVEKEAEGSKATQAAKWAGRAYPFHLLQRDMNQLFENFAHGFDMWRPRFVEPLFGDFQIKLDLKDNEHEIVLSAEIPGVDYKDMEISVSDDTLTIRGEKKEVKEEREKGYYRSERSYGSFQRLVPLPCQIKKDMVDASFKNGVLRVIMPKSDEVMKEVKKVEVKPGS